MRFNILTTGSEIKKVSRQGTIGLPKELIGRYVKVSLLSPKKEKEIIEKVKQAEQFKQDYANTGDRLANHLIKLRKITSEA